MMCSTSVIAAQFNPMFLKDKSAEVDLRYFEKAAGIVPGSYGVDLYLNQRMERRQMIKFQSDDGTEHTDAKPILTLGLFDELGIDIKRLKEEGIVSESSTDDEPVELSRIDGASVDTDMARLSIYISVPQIYIKQQAHRIDPSLWDEGVTALFSNYQLNLTRNTDGDFRNDYGYLGLRNGLNFGQWRLRNESSISQGTGLSRTYSTNRTYLEHDITSLSGRFTFGQLYTNGEIFDSNRIRGFQLSSDTGMLSDDETGYAPVIRGIADTNATVEVRQNGYVIHSTSVSPGAFEIRDIYPSGSNGDLEITIIEADGSKHKYNQAYSYLPVMIRRGSFKYSLSIGKYENERSVSPKLFQSTAVYGLADNLTTYGGVLGSEGYTAINLGMGLNSSLGGMSVDITNSRSRSNNGEVTSGESARFLYSKTLSQTNTTFTMAGYRYSTSGYRTLNEHIDDVDLFNSHANNGRPKHRLDLSINQTLGSNGSLFLSGGETNYWDRTGSTSRLQVGYNGSLGDISYSISAIHTQSAGYSSDADNQFAFTMSVPIGSGSRSHRLYSTLTADEKGRNNLDMGVSGFLNDSNTLSYSAQSGTSGSERSAGLGMGWDAPSAKISANYSKSGSSRHLDLTATGAAIAHNDGVTFSQPVGETFALVDVSGVKGVALEGSTVRTDSSGYTVESYVQPYRYNWVTLDTKTLGSDVDVSDTSLSIVPRRGSVVKTHFAASSGRRVQFEILHADGKFVPFGAQLLDESKNLLAVVDNHSRALVFGVKNQGHLTLKWDKGTCAFFYALPERDPVLIYDQIKATCRDHVVRSR